MRRQNLVSSTIIFHAQNVKGSTVTGSYAYIVSMRQDAGKIYVYKENAMKKHKNYEETAMKKHKNDKE